MAFRYRIHKCHTCSKIVTENDKMDHAEMHKREKEEKVEIERKKKLFYDDFVEKFIRTKKLNEYQSVEKLDLDYIFKNYRKDIDDEQLLFFVRHGMEIGSQYEHLIDEKQTIFLLENDAVSEEDVEGLIRIDDGETQIIEYFLKKSIAIKPQWVRELIFWGNEHLIERIKETHNFQFEDIFSERGDFVDTCMLFIRKDQQRFYDAVHAHFPDPNYIEPKKFDFVTTNHVDDYLHKRYCYDDEKDELSIVVGHDDYEISLGRCKYLIENENNLPELIAEYRDAIKGYVDANQEVSENSDYLPSRNDWANIVAHTYFVIAQKPDTVHRLEYLAMRIIAKEKINFDHLAPALKQKVVKWVF